MKAVISPPIKSCLVTIDISIDEARMLKALVQNPHMDPLDEPDDVATLRKALWDMADSVLIELGTE